MSKNINSKFSLLATTGLLLSGITATGMPSAQATTTNSGPGYCVHYTVNSQNYNIIKNSCTARVSVKDVTHHAADSDWINLDPNETFTHNITRWWFGNHKNDWIDSRWA